MKYTIQKMLLCIAGVALLLSLAVNFPGPTILAVSFLPGYFCIRNVFNRKSVAGVLASCFLVSLSAIPIYLSVGPLICRPGS